MTCSQPALPRPTTRPLATAVNELLDELIDRDRMLDLLRNEQSYQPPEDLRSYVETELTTDRSLPWRQPAGDHATETVEQLRDELRSRLADLLAGQT